ncbi:MAG TPA: ABC transporter permease [Acidimicrobiales bacterium]|nr:ABC transporter permease [Acidimicrobiales bacterium]
MPAQRLSVLPPAFPKELLVNLTQRELKGKFKRTSLGYLWSIINPAVNLAVYAVVFGVFFDAQADPGDPSGLTGYAFFLVCGLLPWTFLANGLMGCSASLVANEGLVKKVYFPRSVIPGAVVLSNVVGFLVELAVLCVALLIAGNMVLPWIPLLLLLVAIQSVFVFGLGLLLAVANTYYRDVSHFLAIFLNVWFYATPILYPITLIGDREIFGIPIQSLVELNPMWVFVDAYRDILYNLRFPTITQWTSLTIGSLAVLAIGAAVFRRFEPRLAEEL